MSSIVLQELSATPSRMPVQVAIESPAVHPLRPLLRAAQDLGADPSALLAATPFAHSTPAGEPKVGPHLLGRLLSGARELTQAPGFALFYGAHCRPSTNGMLGTLLLTSPTLLGALEQVESYQRLLVPWTQLRLHRQGGGASLVLDATPLASPNLALEASAAQLITVVRYLLGERATPRAVEFSHPRPAHAQAYAQLFGCDVRFDAVQTRIELGADLVERPLDLADQTTAHVAGQYCGEQLDPSTTGTSCSAWSHCLTDRIGRCPTCR